MLQELQVSKQKTGRVEAMLREQCSALEKELSSMQAKAQGSYQELQTMQIKVGCVTFMKPLKQGIHFQVVLLLRLLQSGLKSVVYIFQNCD